MLKDWQNTSFDVHHILPAQLKTWQVCTKPNTVIPFASCSQ